jgi:ribosomal protein S12 methylthiotransferase accessory factor YcaO
MGLKEISQTLWETAQALGLEAVSLMDVENSCPIYLAQDDSNSAFGILAIGKGHSEDQRLNATLGEFIERKLMVNRKADFRKSLNDVRGNDLYVSEPTISINDIDASRPLSWMAAKDYSTNKSIYIHRPIREEDEKGLYDHTSNGCALDPSLNGAKIKSIFEVIERDTVLSHWIGGIPPQAQVIIPKGLSRFFDNAINDNFEAVIYLLSNAHGIFTVQTIFRSLCEQPYIAKNGFILGCSTSSQIKEAVLGSIAEVQQILDLAKIKNENIKIHPHILRYMQAATFFEYFHLSNVAKLSLQEIENLEVGTDEAVQNFIDSVKTEERRTTFTQDCFNGLWMTQVFVQGYLCPIFQERNLTPKEISRVQEVATSKDFQISKWNLEPCPLG